MRPFLDPVDDGDRSLLDKVEAVDAMSTVPQPPYPPKHPTRFDSFQDIVSVLAPKKKNLKYKVLISWEVSEEDIDDVDQADIINELYRWGVVDIIRIEETSS